MGDKISSIIDLFDRFETEEDCVRYLYSLRTAGGWTCPKCGAPAPSLLLSRRKVQCTRCSHQEAVTRGTAMEGSHIKLRKWFLAIYLVANDKRGVSACFLAHELRVQWNSAYYLLERVRSMMSEDGSLNVLSGEVELDDAYIGKGGGLRGRGTDKTPFIACAERAKGGKLAIRVVADCSGAAYKEFADWHIADAAHIRTDDWKGAKGGLKDWKGHDPKAFDASDEDARLPLVHHVISNFKAHVKGTYHGVTADRLQSYADEFCWRYNHRGMKAKFELLLADLCRRAHRPRRAIPLLFMPQVTPVAAAA